jgi:hypothetical protein
MEKILPLQYITRHDPLPIQNLESERWFEMETITLSVGEFAGRPNENTVLKSSLVGWLIGEGWRIHSIDGHSVGHWKTGSKSTTTSSTTADSTASSSSTSDSTSHSSSDSSANSSSESESGKLVAGSLVTDTVAGATDHWSFENAVKSSGSSSGKTTADGSSHSGSSGSGSSHEEGGGQSDVSSEADGSPYWAAWNTIVLKRKSLKGDRVLKDMIAELVKAYNRGQTINIDRYEELVNLYALLLSNTEDELRAFSLDPDDFKPLIDEVLDACRDALANFRNKVEDLPDDWMQSRIDEINRKFDKLLEEARSRLITQGLYNGTVWPTTESGIERDRQLALNDLKDDMVTVKIDAYGKIATLTGDIGKSVIDAATKLCSLQAEALKPTEMRNTVFKWMLDFMERREDEQPGLDAVSSAIEKFGQI